MNGSIRLRGGREEGRKERPSFFSRIRGKAVHTRRGRGRRGRVRRPTLRNGLVLRNRASVRKKKKKLAPFAVKVRRAEGRRIKKELECRRGGGEE